ncbi:MAG: TIGR03790 family protein [Thiogranum sp.]|nr:TIGR03790 family protein [Thiogranum sp.]
MAFFSRLTNCFRHAVLLTGLCAATATAAPEPVRILLPEHRLSAHELAIIVNDMDPLSIRIGAYYQRARDIPENNVLHVAFPPGRPGMSRDEFLPIKASIDARTPPHIQAYAITWTSPWRVECMSVTSAFAFGFDPQLCSSRRCATTRPSPLFRRSTTRPWTEFGIRPSMTVAANTFSAARALIDRGVQSDNSMPAGSAYLVVTGDKARDVRSVHYATLRRLMTSWIETEIVHSPGLQHVSDIMFYFTGTVRVPFLDTLNFLPGAIADHLTSAGGKLTGSGQMSALRWLEAGATGSYGTVVEPCNHLGKFPNPGLLMESYGAGRTLLEAYWQSVQQPGEGIFIGEPLAAPFDGYRLTVRENDLLLTTRTLLPGNYQLSVSEKPVGPYRPAGMIQAQYHQKTFVLPKLDAGYYKLDRATPVGSPASATGRHGAAPGTAKP